ncbi:MAG: HpcH/HpaI aldolase family protein [Arenicellales bacterium]
MKQPSIKTKLRSGQRLNGCWIESFSPIATEIMAISGYDTAMIDLEHGAGSYLDAISMMQALDANDCQPMIRATSADHAVLKRVLDIGPQGMMVPNVRNEREARDVVSGCRYGPRGVRGAAPVLLRATDYGKHVAQYEQRMDEDFLLIGQIESQEAVDQIDAIAAVDGIDMLFIGPIDLSASLGGLGEFDSETFIRAFEKIEKATLAAGKFLGCIPFAHWTSERLFQNGHHLVLSGSDTVLLRGAAEQDVHELQAARDRALTHLDPTG